MSTSVNFSSKFDVIDGLPKLSVLFEPLLVHAKIGIAVSGGSDSVALMLLLAEWALYHKKTLHIYTVDHGLRPAAASEAQGVVKLAEKFGLSARVLRWEGPKPSTGVQAKARAARYDLIKHAMVEDDVHILTSAHHLEDQAETVLMRLAHGSGLNGLSAMRSNAVVAGVDVFRPLLAVPKDVLSACVQLSGEVSVQDPSNADRHYERVRWRQMMPQLTAEGLNPLRLADFARRSARANDALAVYTQAAVRDVVAISPFGELTVSHADFCALPEEIALRLLSHMVGWAGARARPFALSPLENLLANLLENEALAPQTMSGAVICSRDKQISVMRESAKINLNTMSLKAGETVCWDGRFRVSNVSSDQVFRILDMKSISRKWLKDNLNQSFRDSSIAIRGAPMVVGPDDQIICAGTHPISDAVCVKLSF